MNHQVPWEYHDTFSSFFLRFDDAVATLLVANALSALFKVIINNLELNGSFFFVVLEKFLCCLELFSFIIYVPLSRWYEPSFCLKKLFTTCFKLFQESIYFLW